MPMSHVVQAIKQVKTLTGIADVGEIVTTAKCRRRARDGRVQPMTIEILYRESLFTNRYQIQARTTTGKSANGTANSLDEALRSVRWQDLDS